MMRVLELIKDGINLEAELDKLPKIYSTDEIKIEVNEENKFKIIEVFKEHLNELGLPEILEVIEIDGVRVHFKNAWALLRASNTTPVLVARFESTDEGLKNEIEDKFIKFVNEIKDNL